MPTPADAWPELTYEEDVATTLHLWTQVVGKVRLALSPMVNHWWQVTLYLTSRGLTTSAMPTGDGRALQIDFDFLGGGLRLSASNGTAEAFALEPMSVAAFHAKVMSALDRLSIKVSIYASPVEVVEAIPFAEDDRHAAYDAEWARRFWGALVQAQRVFERFRGGFVGKVSPVHFFWGAADLAVTRFSGRPAPPHPGGIPHCADWVMREAYSHEVSSAGFWAGAGLGEPAFYSYAYPAPDGFAERRVEPASAYFHKGMGEFVLPYAAVRSADDPDAAVRAFLDSTYAVAADLAGWDRAALER